LREHVADELNVRALDALDATGDLVDVTAKANYRALGKRFGPRTPDVAAAIAAADPAVLAAALRGSGTATVDVGGEQVAVGPDDVVVSETPRAGWAVAAAGGETVALDLELTDELRRAGAVREVIRLVQEARKTQGFDVSDRIELWWQADSETAQALAEAESTLQFEVLATSVTRGRPNAPMAAHEAGELGLTFWLRAIG
jgi:isoleucyl-tRNA synthetase